MFDPEIMQRFIASFLLFPWIICSADSNSKFSFLAGPFSWYIPVELGYKQLIQQAISIAYIEALLIVRIIYFYYLKNARISVCCCFCIFLCKRTLSCLIRCWIRRWSASTCCSLKRWSLYRHSNASAGEICGSGSQLSSSSDSQFSGAN
jgi:hypothetical protein